MESLLAAVANFGVAVAILFAIGVGVWKIAPWFAARLDRLMDRHLAALDEVAKWDARITSLEARLTAVWEFFLRRGTVEAIQKGVGTMNSPLVITQESKGWLAGIAPRLREIYRRLGPTVADARLAEEIELVMGDDLVRAVCLPHGLSQAACLLIAVDVARSPEPGAL